MRIAINMSTMRGHGSSMVGSGILLGLSELSVQHQYFSFIPSSWINLPNFDERFSIRRIAKGIEKKACFENISLRKFLKKQKIDVLFSCGDTSLPACPIPHLLLLHQAHIVRNNKNKEFETKLSFKIKMTAMRLYFKAMLPSVTKFTVQTQNMKSALCNCWSIPTDQVVVIPSAIFVPQSTDNVPNTSSKKWTIGYVASASPHKNHILLPDIIGKLCSKYPEISCALTVTPEEVPQMVGRAYQLGIFKHFKFLGSLPYAQAISLYRDFHIFVMPSKLESFGLPYYEAMSQGTAMVVADKAFAREACADAALYADADNASEFADRINELLSAPYLYSEMRERALNRYQNVRISWSEVAQRYLSILESIASPYFKR